MTTLAFSHREWRRCHGGPRYVAVFNEIWPGICRYPDCRKSRHHSHGKETGDLTAAELLDHDPEDARNGLEALLAMFREAEQGCWTGEEDDE